MLLVVINLTLIRPTVSEFRGHGKLGYIWASFGRPLGKSFRADPATVARYGPESGGERKRG